MQNPRILSRIECSSSSIVLSGGNQCQKDHMIGAKKKHGAKKDCWVSPNAFSLLGKKNKNQLNDSCKTKCISFNFSPRHSSYVRGCFPLPRTKTAHGTLKGGCEQMEDVKVLLTLKVSRSKTVCVCACVEFDFL